MAVHLIEFDAAGQQERHHYERERREGPRRASAGVEEAERDEQHNIGNNIDGEIQYDKRRLQLFSGGDPFDVFPMRMPDEVAERQHPDHENEDSPRHPQHRPSR